MDLGQVHYVHPLFAILSTEDRLSIVKQVIQLATVDLVEAEIEFQVLVLIQVVDDVVGGEQVEAGDALITRTHHGKCFAGAGLPVRETRRLRSLKRLRYKRFNTHLVYLMIVLVFGKGVVKGEQVLFNELGQVNFQPTQQKKRNCG